MGTRLGVLQAGLGSTATFVASPTKGASEDDQ